MSHAPFRFKESWSFRDGTSTVHIHQRGNVTDPEAAHAVAPGLMRSRLERWMRSSPQTLRSLYVALEGTWPWRLTSLERPAHEQRVVSRLVRAFESGVLVALVEEMPVVRGYVPERETFSREEAPVRPGPVPKAPRPAPAAEPAVSKAPAPAPAAEPAVDAAAQARTLSEAARAGVPFCEECEQREPPAPAAEPAVDAAAQARTLREAARSGVPFCEECEQRGPPPPQQNRPTIMVRFPGVF